jgi:hypothetical protein
MRLDGHFANEKAFCDVLVAEALRDESKHFGFAF